MFDPVKYRKYKCLNITLGEFVKWTPSNEIWIWDLDYNFIKTVEGLIKVFELGIEGSNVHPNCTIDEFEFIPIEEDKK